MTARLVVVDLQEVFADPASEWHAPRFAAIREPVAALVAAYEPAVTFTRFVAPAAPDGAWRDYYAQFPWALVPPDDELYRLVPPWTGRPTLDATTFGKWGPELAAVTDGELVLAGVSTDCCVVATALAAADAGVRVRVAADACAGGSDAGHEQALALMGLFAPLIEVTDTAALT